LPPAVNSLDPFTYFQLLTAALPASYTRAVRSEWPHGRWPQQILEHEAMAEWFVAKAADLPDGDRRIVTAGNNEIGVFHHGGTYYAYSNYCVHSGGPACEGILINQVVDLIAPDRTYQGQTFSDEVHFVCPWHGYEYKLATGQCVGDRKLKLKKFEVVRRGDDLYVVA
jgi:nitrite reductase/ring-hydroxylating ferredoxin subunit